MNKSYSRLTDAVRRYLQDFAESGYSSAGAETLAASLQADTATPLHALFSVFGCGDFERMAIAFGFAVRTDAACAALIAEAFGTPVGTVSPQALCTLILGEDRVADCAAFFTEEGLLHRLFDGTSPVFCASMTLKASVFAYLLNGTVPQKYLTPLPEAAPPDAYAAPALQTAIRALETDTDVRAVILNIHGTPGSGRKTVLADAASHCGMAFAVLSDWAVRSVPPEEIAALLALSGTFPVLIPEGSGEMSAYETCMTALAGEIGLVILLTQSPLTADDADADLISVAVPLPSVAEQSVIWERKSAAYSVESGIDFREIAMEFSLPPGAIDKAFRFAALKCVGGAPFTAADIKRGCYASVGSSMGNRAVRVNCAFGWDDLVLPPHSKKLLRTACDYVRFGCTVYEKWNFGAKLPYGRGASMIFTGPPGTGKTMAAQVMAHELGLELYKVNLASVVSKYIGETEKNLQEIFENAKKSRVVLFFDEADVLFGKRTEVKDANDKYSNMEAAFLLQKIEEYNGIAILATNFVQNFDEAFKRRMKFLIEFPFPGAQQRSEIWQKAFPADAPLGKLDLDYLVENFELSGSNIKNIALHSAFLAAAAGEDTIEMKHIVAALKNEFAKSGKSFTRAEAGEYFYYLDN